MCAVTNFTLFCPLSMLCPSEVGFFGTCLSGPEEPSKKEGKDKNTLFCPHCVQSAKTGVKYQDDPKVEEVLSHQHSILVLHDPLQVDCTSLI